MGSTRTVRARTVELTEDPAKTIGPCDFNEKDFREHRSLYDWLKLSVLLSSLPMAVAVVSTYDQVKFRLHRFFRDVRYKGARRTMWDSVMDAAMDYIAMNTSWTQLRVLTPLHPLRKELDSARYSGLSHYNYYFGGDDFSARWLSEIPDRTPSDPVILYLHGGSYAIKTQRLQLDYMAYLSKKLAPYRASVLVLDYTIGHYRKYPAQLQEALSCHRLLEQSCEKIVVLGDSCGGHLGLAMLLSGAKLAGMMLVSPTTDLTGDSHDERTMRESFLEPGANFYDPLVSPVKADTRTWTKCLPGNTAMVWGSEEECARQMKEWVDVSRITNYYEEVGGGHDCILRGSANLGSRFVEAQLKDWLGQSVDSDSQETPSVDSELPQKALVDVEGVHIA